MGDIPTYYDASTIATVQAQTEASYSWCMFKHQIRLTVAMLRAQLDNDLAHGQNILLSPHWMISSLSTLVPGKDTESRVQLAKTLFFVKASGKMDSKSFVYMNCANNRFTMKGNKNSLKVNSFHYRDPSNPIKPGHVKKLLKNYHTTGKELQLLSNEKPCLESLQTINQDFANSNGGSMLSTADYVSLVNSTVDTVLLSSIQFSGLWSKTFEVQYGEFHKSNGESVKTELLYKEKSFMYLEDKQSMSSAIKINYKHDTNIAMVLILPDENISIEHFVKHLLDYETLKRIIKGLRIRCEVKLTLPKFKLTANRQMAKPIQQLANLLQLDQEELHKNKNTTCIPPVDDNVVLFQRVSLEIDHHGATEHANNRSKLSNLISKRKEAQFTADRPFLFALVTTGVAQQILYMGVCQDPTRTQ